MEINIKELRVGSYVNIIGLVATHITSKHIVAIDEGDDQYEPIPLTPEILERCGFRLFGLWYINDSVYLGDASIQISLEHNKTTIGRNEEYEIKHIIYLHQLQNIIYDLTEIEIELK